MNLNFHGLNFYSKQPQRIFDFYKALGFNKQPYFYLWFAQVLVFGVQITASVITFLHYKFLYTHYQKQKVQNDHQ